MSGEPRMDPAALRRRLHRQPELAFLEVLTAATVIELVEPYADDVRFGREVIDLELVASLPDPDERAAAVARARSLSAHRRVRAR